MENGSFFCYRIKGFDIIITDNGSAISGLFFDRERAVGLKKAESPLIQKAAAQIKEYFEGSRKQFKLPIAMHGTEFQLAVWQALQKIPYGETRSYKEIAASIGRPKAVRAVGMANNRNPISIIVPCPRVIGHNGKLVGYGGGLPLKQYLLDLERTLVFGGNP